MPFVFNGTTIPENVPNAFSFNGTDITDVFFNGVQVWHQSLINITGWSGNSITNTYGIQTSGLLWRANSDGAWISTSGFGVFTGNSNSWGGSSFVEPIYITTSGSQFMYGTDWITFEPSLESFSGTTNGTSTSYNVYAVGETLAGLFRHCRYNASGFVSAGGYISLT
jgi:hypothetical protein